MRRLFSLIFTVISFVASVGFAGASLEDNMKTIGDRFKSIGATVSEPAQNTDNAKSAVEMVALFKLTKEQTPNYLQELPEAKRSAAFVAYQDMIQQCIDLSEQLVQAFVGNDNAMAKALYRQLKDLRQDGHDQFDP